MILPGDCLEILPTLPAESVQCCVTSPPYYNLRDYGVEGQIGLDPLTNQPCISSGENPSRIERTKVELEKGRK